MDKKHLSPIARARVAKNFTESVITGAKYFAEPFDIKLYEYKAVKIGDDKFIICNENKLSKIAEIPEKPKTIDDQLNYITDGKVQEVFSDTIKVIKGLGENVEVTPTKWGISFKYRGRNFAAIYPRREAIVVDWKQSDGWYSETEIKRIERVQEIVQRDIRKSFELEGGKPAIAPETKSKLSK